MYSIICVDFGALRRIDLRAGLLYQRAFRSFRPWSGRYARFAILFRTHLMLKSTTASLKPAEVDKKWIHIDAEGVVVGRLATFIANRLRGKHLPTYTPHVDCGDYVIVTNVDKVVFTGKKNTDKVYYRHTGHPGGIKETTPAKVLGGRFPERVLEKAVERMLPKESPLARKQMTHLRLFTGSTHTHEAQQPETIDFASASAKNTRSV
jgi:large subunit ribosomal protein L13